MMKVICTRCLTAVVAGLLSAPSPASGTGVRATERDLELNALVGTIRLMEQDPTLKYASQAKDKFGNVAKGGGIGITAVIPSNLERWSRICLGRVVTPGEYLGNVRAQLDLSYCVIGRFWDRYHDARIVASCWRKGQTDFRDDSNITEDPINKKDSARKYTVRFLRKLKDSGRPKLAIDIDKGPSVKNEFCQM